MESIIRTNSEEPPPTTQEPPPCVLDSLAGCVPPTGRETDQVRRDNARDYTLYLVHGARLSGCGDYRGYVRA
jgi:hypothetical protein